MSEIADELEMLAEEFESLRSAADGLADPRRHGRDEVEHFDGRASAFKDAAERLRERAAELRAQRTGPTYKPQPKPAEVRAGQWWAFRECAPDRVTSFEPEQRGGGRRVFFNDVDWEYTPESQLLTSDLYQYFGDGPEPAR